MWLTMDYHILLQMLFKHNNIAAYTLNTYYADNRNPAWPWAKSFTISHRLFSSTFLDPGLNQHHGHMPELYMTGSVGPMGGDRERDNLFTTYHATRMLL
jgi:hypothetical protein